jgi:hypothetical protein
MYCPSCGTALAQHLKYCNRCGAHLVTTKAVEAVELFEKRIDRGMEGLVFLTVLALALILGGMALMKRIQLGEYLIIAYMVLSSAAFIALFGLGVWQLRRLARSSKEAIGTALLEQPDVSELGPAVAATALEIPASVTEHTTRGLVQVPGDRVT